MDPPGRLISVRLDRKSGDGDPITVKIPAKIWNEFSEIKKETFKGMLIAPNAYLYRHRPPGDPQRYGQFTEDEIQKVIARYKYFYEDLKVGKLWGLFALPFPGRLGYQCASQVRKLIVDGVIKTHTYMRDEKGNVILRETRDEPRNTDAEERLAKEASEYLLNCLQETYNISDPFRVDEFGQKVPVKRRMRFQKKRESLPVEPLVNDNDHVSSYESEAKTEEDHTESDASDDCGYEYDPEDEDTPCRGAPDPLMAEPMNTPMMDMNTKLVMDRTSWIKVLVDGVPAPQTFATEFGTVVKVTKHVFHAYRNEMCGVYF